MSNIIKDGYYVVDISDLKKPRLYRRNFGGIVDANDVIENKFYNDYENSDIITAELADYYNLKYIESGKSQFMGSGRMYSTPRRTDEQGRMNFRMIARRKLKNDFRKNLPGFLKFLKDNPKSYLRTFKNHNTQNIHFLVNSVPEYIKPKYFKTVMDCLILNPEKLQVAFLKTKILEVDKIEPIPCKEFLGLLKTKLEYLVKLNRYHPAIINYEKLGLTISRYGAKNYNEKTETILSL